MSDTGNQQANSEAEITPVGRRTGPPKGTPRAANAGRKKGTPNRATRDVREAARKYTTRALTALAKLLVDPDPKVRAIAARELLDRAHGKPMAPTEITGRDGEPLHPPAGDMTDIEIARLIAFTLTQGDRQASKLAEAAIAPRAASGQTSVKVEPKTQVVLAGQPGSTAPLEPTAADREATDDLLDCERARKEELREQLRRPDQVDFRQEPPKIIRFPRRDR